MIIDKLAYKVTVQAQDFLAGKRKVEAGAEDLRNKLNRTSNETAGGLSKITLGMRGLQEQGQKTFSGFQVGAAKFLGVALTFGAAQSIFMSTTKQLVQLGNSSAFLGMSAKSLDGFTRAASSAGVAGSSVVGMLGKIKNAQLWSRTGMGAPDESTIAMQQLQAMTGVNVIGAKDPGQGLLRQATALRKMNRDQAQVMWQKMGGSDDMFNLMYSGNMATLQADFEKRSNATPAAIKQAQDVTKTLEELKATANGVAQDFVRIFGKDVNDILKDLSSWLERNKGDISGFFRESSEWAKKFTDAVGGTTNALAILAATWAKTPMGALMAAGLAANHGYDEIMKYNDQKYGKDTVAGGNLKAHSILGRAWSAAGGFFSGMDSSAIGISNAKAGEVTPSIPGVTTGRVNIQDQNQASGKLMDALMMTESGGNPLAYNAKSGAAGAYQFMPGTARELGLTVNGNVDERLDPEKSRAAASAYMSQLLRHYNGNVTEALQAYNWGIGNMDAYKKTGRGIKGQEMPLETQQYASRVAGYYGRMNDAAGTPVNSSSSQVDNSQTNSTHIGEVKVYSNPESADKLSQSIQQQAQRSHVTVTYGGGVNP